MPSERVRVLPPIPRKGLHYLSIALGFTHGLAGAWLFVLFFDAVTGFSSPFARWGFYRTGLLLVCVFFIPSILFSMLLTRVHPHFWRTVLCGVLYGPPVLAGIFAVVLARNPEM